MFVAEPSAHKEIVTIFICLPAHVNSNETLSTLYPISQNYLDCIEETFFGGGGGGGGILEKSDNMHFA